MAFLIAYVCLFIGFGMVLDDYFVHPVFFAFYGYLSGYFFRKLEERKEKNAAFLSTNEG